MKPVRYRLITSVPLRETHGMGRILWWMVNEELRIPVDEMMDEVEGQLDIELDHQIDYGYDWYNAALHDDKNIQKDI